MCPLLTNSRSRLLGGGRLAVPVPMLGANTIVNGDFETWASATDAGTWTETLAGTTTLNRDTDAHGGTYALRIDTDGSNSLSSVRQNSIATAGKWYLMSIWLKGSAAGKFVSLGSQNFPWSSSVQRAITTGYAEYLVAGRASGANIILGMASGAGQANMSAWFDDVSLKEITLASMFSTRPYSTHCTTKAACTVVAGTRAGVVANLDSASSPANGILASVDGSTARMTKLVNGVYTELVSQTITYVAGSFVEVRRAVGTNNYTLYYNGSAVGAAQTVNDASVISGVLHGFFNSYSGNLLTQFSCVPSA